MPLIFDLLIFAVSLSLLYVGARLIIFGASSLARAAGISDLVIGSTIVTFGTSLPELSTSIAAMLSGSPGIVAGNIIGSNVANIGLAMGLSALIYPIYVSRSVMDIHVPFLLASAMASLVAFIDGMVTWTEGIILLTMYAAFLARGIIHERGKERETDASFDFDRLSVPALAAGIVLLYYGSGHLVLSLGSISSTLGISEAVAAFLLLALGTSLPEISTAIVAAREGRGEIAMGNVLGANSFNVLVNLGASSLLGDVSADEGFLLISLPAVMLMSILLGFMSMNSRLARFEGALLILIYLLVVGNVL